MTDALPIEQSLTERLTQVYHPPPPGKGKDQKAEEVQVEGAAIVPTAESSRANTGDAGITIVQTGIEEVNLIHDQQFV